MINENVQIPRWRAVVLCVAGVLAMTKPLASGVSLYRASLPAPVGNYSPLYGWVEEGGPHNANERWRGEQRLRVVGYPRERFAEEEIRRAADEVRAQGLAEVRRLRLEELEKSRRALGDRAVAVLFGTVGVGGVVFYLWLGYTLLHETGATTLKDPQAGWFGKKKRHGRITFGRQAA